MSETITLFDLPSKPPTKCWSLNPWKTRFLLNYKEIPYVTAWTEYPDLRPTLQPHVSANTDGSYTSPTVKFEDGTFVMESRKIAEVIEQRQPSPPIYLDDPKLVELEGYVTDIKKAIAGVYVPHVHARLLNPPSAEYFRRTREAKFDMSLEELAEKKGGDKAWAKVSPYLNKVTKLLEKEGGPYFRGKEVSYADFVWGGLLVFWRSIGQDRFDDLLKASGNAEAHLSLLEALEPWWKRDDH